MKNVTTAGCSLSDSTAGGGGSGYPHKLAPASKGAFYRCCHNTKTMQPEESLESLLEQVIRQARTDIPALQALERAAFGETKKSASRSSVRPVAKGNGKDLQSDLPRDAKKGDG